MAQNVIEITVKSKDEGKSGRESIKSGYRQIGDVADETDKRTSGFGKRLAKVGAAAVAGLAAAAVGIGKALYDVGATMEEMENKIRIGTGASGEALAGLVDDAKAVGTAVPSSLSDVGDAVADLNTRVGLTGKPLQDLAGQFLNLSRITGTDVQTNIASLTRVFGDWGISAEEQSATLDKMFRASQATGIGVDELAQKVVQFGAPLRQMGFSFEESIALLGKFEKEGVNGELVLGSLRQALGKIAKSSQDAGKASLEAEKAQQAYNDAVKEHGAGSLEARTAQDKLTQAQSKGSMAGKDASEIFREYVENIKNAGSVSEANGLALELFGARAGPDMAAAIREGRLSIDDLVNSINTGADTINAASLDTMTFSEQWQLTKNRLMVAFQPAAAKVFEALGEAMEKLGPKLVKMGEDLGPTLSVIIEALISVISSSLPIIQMLATVIAGLGPAAAPIIGVLAVATGGIKAFGAAHAIISILPARWGALAGSMLINFAKMTGAAVVHGAASAGAAVAAAAAWVAANAAMILATGGILLAIAAVIAIVILVVKNWDWVKEKAGAIWGAIWGAIKAAGEGIKKAVKGLVDFVLYLIMNWTIVGPVIRHWDKIKAVFKAGVDAAVGFVKKLPSMIWNSLVGLKDILVNLGKDMISGLVRGIKSAGSWLKSQIVSFIKTFVPGPVLRFLGIASDSKMFIGIGKNVGGGLGRGILSTVGLVARASQQLARAAGIGDITTGYRAVGSNAMATAIASRTSAGAGGRIQIELNSAGSRLDDLLLEVLRNALRARGLDATVLGGR